MSFSELQQSASFNGISAIVANAFYIVLIIFFRFHYNSSYFFSVQFQAKKFFLKFFLFYVTVSNNKKYESKTV